MAKPELPLVEGTNAPRELREAVRAARAREPRDTDLTRMAASFGFGLPSSLPPPAAPVGAAASAKAGLLAKGAAAIGAASVATAVVLRLTAPPSEPPKAPSAPLATTAALPSQRPLEPDVREAREAPEPSPARPVARVQREERSPAPSAAAAPPAAESPSDVAASDSASRLREEALLVRRAQSLLASDPAGALRLTAERRRQFPSGVLAQEASVVTIEALLRLGRRAEAEAQARAFEAAHPGSVHARRVRKLLEGE